MVDVSSICDSNVREGNCFVGSVIMLTDDNVGIRGGSLDHLRSIKVPHNNLNFGISASEFGRWVSKESRNL